MLSLLNDFDRIAMPTLLGWDPSRVLGNFTSISGSSPIEVKYDNDRVYITADMPGVDPEHLDLTFEGGSLSVVGQRDENKSYRFTVQLGNEYDGDKIEAQLDKGVLTISAEKRPEAKPKKIALKGGGAKSLESGESK
jgi:HSP20 family protein